VPTRIAAEITAFDAKKYILARDHRKGLRMMARPIQMAVSCANAALEKRQGRSQQASTPLASAVEFGAGLIATELPDVADAAKASANCQPGHVDLEKWGAEGIPRHPAAVDAEVPAEHAGLSHLDLHNRPGAEQLHHRK